MSKVRGTPGGNPDPVRNGRFPPPKDIEGVELARRPTCVKLPIAIDAIVRSLPDRSAWLRAAILEKLERDGLVAQSKESQICSDSWVPTYRVFSMSKKASNDGWPQLTSNTIKDHIALAVFKTEKKHGGNFLSGHELYAVLLEEIEEFQDSCGDPDPAELMDTIAAAYLGVRWLSKDNGEDISSLLAKKSDTEPLAIEDVQGLCASMLRDLKTFWASVKKNEPSCQALVKLIDTTSEGLLWLCQEGRNEIQEGDGAKGLTN